MSENEWPKHPYPANSSWNAEMFQEGGLAEMENIASAKRFEMNKAQKQKEFARRRLLIDEEGRGKEKYK